jgi:hypothetical protein
VDFTVTWYDGPPTTRRELNNIAPVQEAQAHERQFETEIEALAFALDLFSQRTAYTVTLEGPHGERLADVQLRRRLREARLVGSARSR